MKGKDRTDPSDKNARKTASCSYRQSKSTLNQERKQKEHNQTPNKTKLFPQHREHKVCVLLGQKSESLLRPVQIPAAGQPS